MRPLDVLLWVVAGGVGLFALTFVSVFVVVAVRDMRSGRPGVEGAVPAEVVLGGDGAAARLDEELAPLREARRRLRDVAEIRDSLARCPEGERIDAGVVVELLRAALEPGDSGSRGA